MLSLDAQNISQQYLHRLMLGSIAPRPIAFVSTIDLRGNPNLAPFSFFNAFGVNPGTLIFSPSRRGRDNTTKHTYENLLEVPEAVINVVDYNMVQQMSLASCEYPKGVNEFEKAGFTSIQSEKVRPGRVGESPVQYECRVRELIPTGNQAGAGNLVICDILRIHIREDVLDANQEIDQTKIDLVGRMGGDFYVRTNENARFVVPKPVSRNGIGIDVLPVHIRHSPYLTGNDLGQMGNLEHFPEEGIIETYRQKETIRHSYLNQKETFFYQVRQLIQTGKANEALAMLMSVE